MPGNMTNVTNKTNTNAGKADADKAAESPMERALANFAEEDRPAAEKMLTMVVSYKHALKMLGFIDHRETASTSLALAHLSGPAPAPANRKDK